MQKLWKVRSPRGVYRKRAAIIVLRQQFKGTRWNKAKNALWRDALKDHNRWCIQNNVHLMMMKILQREKVMLAWEIGIDEDSRRWRKRNSMGRKLMKVSSMNLKVKILFSWVDFGQLQHCFLSQKANTQSSWTRASCIWIKRLNLPLPLLFCRKLKMPSLICRLSVIIT